MCRFRGRRSIWLGSWKLRTGGSCSATLVRGAICELAAENWRHCSTTLVRGAICELEAENWQLSSTTLVRGAICRAGS